MPKDSSQRVVNDFSGALHTDNDPSSQPKGSHTFMLNGVDQAADGKYTSKSNEESNYASTILPNGFVPLGKRYIEDDLNVVILVNPSTGIEQIATVNKDNVYTTIVETRALGLSIRNMCDIRYRLRRGNEKIIYWVDAKNKARTFNLSKPYNFYNNIYSDYLKSGGNPTTFLAEKWDVSSFDLVKSYTTIPFFSTVTLLDSGSIVAGSYNFAIQYVDSDLNPTEWISTSNIVRIFNDTLTNPYERIRGSRGNATLSQSFPRASKSIKLQITNLDQNYPYYRIAIIQSIDGTATPAKSFASDLYSTGESNFIYTGNDSELTEVALGEILIDKEIIFAPQHIEQLENRLVLSNTKGKNIAWCEFQKYASKIRTDLTTKQVILNSVESKPNSKNVNSTFILRGYMPGEVYSIGIAYIFDDGTVSPVFTVPGRNIADSTSKMLYHEITNKYLDVHDCVTNDYWGRDYVGQALVGRAIRHHRFPFRKQVNKPLVTTTATNFTITRYRLILSISLNPAFTPSPSYPDDGGSPPFPLDINYTMNYKVLGSGTDSSFTSTLTKTIATTLTPITIYDDVDPLTFITGSEYATLDSGCDLATYQGGGNDQFILGLTYQPYTTTSPSAVDTSEIFGIKFFNVEKPHPNVVGFYIVRNERQDDDRMIIDTAIFGAMTKFNEYRSFGLINPKQFYTANNCSRVEVPNKVLQYDDKTVWFFNPEHHYLQDTMEFDTVEIEGSYEETSVDMPTGCTGLFDQNPQFGLKGVYIDDVQAGTSFNPDVNKNKDRDDDGFDLVIGYRNTNIKYIPSIGVVFPAKNRIIRLTATAHQTFGGNIYYNVSTDNKISMLLSDSTFNTNLFYNTTSKKNSLIYGALVKNNTSSYSNFISRPYYKEHNNPILFGTNSIVDNIEIFNGDVEIGATNLVSTVFSNMVVATRAKKSRVWAIVVGVVLVVVGILTAIYGVGIGLTAAGASALAGLAVSYGVSLAMSGLKFEQMKKMIDEDYDKGLRETVTDGGVFETIRDSIGTFDDTIRWFSDRVSNVYMESRVPIALRVGTTAGISDFIDAPAPYNEEAFKSYLTEKLTIIDRDQGSGRLYKGFAGAEFYDANKDYMRFNKEKEYIHLPLEYDCCSLESEVFPVRNWYSEQSFQEELIDNYRVFLPNNFKDIEGEHGEITGLYRLGNSLFIHTREALWELPASIQERTIGEIVSFIGTGEFFSLPPRKIVDDNLGSAGTKHKWGSLKTTQGVFFISEVEHKIHLHGQKLQDITEGHKEWFETNLVSFLDNQLFHKFGINHLNNNNPANPSGTGYISVYDARNKRIIFTKKDCILAANKLSAVTLVTDIPASGTAFNYCLADGQFYHGTTVIYLDNPNYFENKSWTISYSFHKMKWSGYHSYLPNFYIQGQTSFYSYIYGINKLWRHGRFAHYQTFYDVFYPFILEYVKLSNPLESSSFEDITLQTNARIFDFVKQAWVDQRYITFNKITVYNERQCSGEQEMIVKDTQANPANYLQQQIVNTNGVLLITRRKKDWNINELRDYVDDYSEPMFTLQWASIRSNYYIDKVINSNVINMNKAWYELESFQDKYAIIRLKFDNFENVNLLLNFSIETEQSTD